MTPPPKLGGLLPNGPPTCCWYLPTPRTWLSLFWLSHILACASAKTSAPWPRPPLICKSLSLKVGSCGGFGMSKFNSLFCLVCEILEILVNCDLWKFYWTYEVVTLTANWCCTCCCNAQSQNDEDFCVHIVEWFESIVKCCVLKDCWIWFDNWLNETVCIYTTERLCKYFGDYPEMPIDSVKNK